MNTNDILRIYDDAPAKMQEERRELPVGRHLLRIKVTEKELWNRPYGTEEDPVELPRARLHLTALDPITQESLGMSSFYNFKLGVDTHYYDGVHPDGVWLPNPEETIRDENGKVKQKSTGDAQVVLAGKIKKFLEAIGLERVASDDVFEAFRVDDWDGKVFVGRWDQIGPKGGDGAVFLRNFYHVDHPEFGVASLPVPKSVEVDPTPQAERL